MAMKELVFGEGLLGATLSGEKQATIRRYRPEAHDFKKDEIVLGVFKDGWSILLRITDDTVVKPLSKLSDEEARASGFKDARDARKGLKRWYPDLKRTDTAAVVRHEILKVDGVQVATLNQHNG